MGTLPTVSLWQLSEVQSCRQQMEPEQPEGRTGEAERWKGEAALLTLQGRKLAILWCSGERSQGTAALLEAWLSCLFCCWSFELHNPREALGKPSSQGKSKPWAHHLSQNPVQSRAMASTDFIVLGDGCDGECSGFPTRDVSQSFRCSSLASFTVFVFSSMTDKPSSVKNASLACARRERDPWQRTWLLWL